MIEKKNNAKVYLGLVVLTGGFLALLHRLGIVHLTYYDKIFSWETLLILIGVYQLFKEEYTWGIILIGIGVFFGFKEYIPEIKDVFWPVVAIVAGISILMNGFGKKKT